MYKNFNKGLFTNLVHNIVATSKPVNQKHVEEASSVGLTLLAKGCDLNYNLYRFNDCGHTAFLQSTHVRRGHVKCNTCLYQRDVALFYKTGSIVIFSTGETRYTVIRKCGHLVNTLRAAANNATDKCKICFEEQLAEHSENNNYEYLGQSKGTYRKIRFKSCGHTKVLQFSQIVKGNAVCGICREEKYAKDAELHRLKYLHKTNNGYAMYELPCGCDKELRIDHASDGSWLCHIHQEDTHYAKPSNVYLLEIKTDSFSWLKLGFARNLELRSNSYGVGAADISVLKVLEFDTGWEAMSFEKELHRRFKQDRLCKKLMKNYHKFNGFTECYPVSKKDDIVKALEFSRCSDV